MKKSNPEITRRDFMITGAATLAGLSLVPSELKGAVLSNSPINRLMDSSMGQYDGQEDHLRKPATTGKTGKYPYHGKGKIVLEKNIVRGINILTQDMINNANTTYIIQYDYVLSGNITIPDRCIVVFDGGSISGKNVLTFQYTLLEGYPSIGCEIAGTITNDFFNVLWISDGDIGYKINKAGGVFCNILIPEGDFVFTTPVNLKNVRKLVCNATLKYDGKYINNSGIFKIRTWGAYIYIYQLIPNDRKAIDYLDSRKINAVGLEIQSCNNCEIHVMRMEYFNENLRISDVNHSGCSYNKFFVGVLASANFNIRLYQHDSPDGISWTNENIFIGGRLTHWTDSRRWGEYWNIGIGGPKIDKPSYKTSAAVDNEDTCNGLTFIGTSIETNKKSLLLRNVTDSQFIGLREESTTGFAKIVGRFNDNYYIPKFTSVNNLFKSDLSEATEMSLHNFQEAYNKSCFIVADDNLSLDNRLVKYTGFVANNEDINHSIHLNHLSFIGVLIPLAEHLLFAVQTNKDTRIVVKLIDTNGRNITGNHANINIAYQTSYYSSIKGFQSNTDMSLSQFHIPPVKGVSKVFVGVLVGRGISFSLYSNVNVEVPLIPTYGDRRSRPKALPKHVPYFDTSLRKDIFTKSVDYNNENATVWMDALGNVVV